MGQNPRVNAQFSAQWCVANAIAKGSSRLEHFRPDAVADATIERLLPRIRVVADGALDARGHSAVDLSLRTRDGRSASAGFDVSPGFPGNPLGEHDHRSRFDDCLRYAAYPLPPGQGERLAGAIDELEHLRDARDLLRFLVAAGR
jgi:2-methylcitrate dehydratase PrpD